MGALRKLLPWTSATFIVGWLAIAGVPPFSGFWSKDEILLFAWDKSPLLWAVGFVAAILTAFYMSREVFMVFYGDAKWDRPLTEAAPELAADREAAGITGGHGVGPVEAIHPHESGWKMVTPLVVLAGLATVAGALNTPFVDKGKFLERWLEPVVSLGEAHVGTSAAGKWGLVAVTTIGALLGIAAAVVVYLRKRADLRAKVEQPILAKAWFYDRAVTAFAGGPGRKGFEGVAAFDRTVVDGAVNGVGTAVREGSGKGRLAQSGYVRNYALGLAVGAVLIAALLLSKAVY